MNDPQNEPRTCPYCDQPLEDTFPNRIRFRCGSATRQPGHVTPKQSEECQLRVALRAAQTELAAARSRYEKQCEGTHSRMREIISLRQQLTDTQAELARLQHESTAHRLAWQNAEAREKELREDAERFVWLAQNGGGFAHDEGSRGISTHKWGEWASGPFTVNDFRRGIDAARAALAKKEAQP